MRKARAQTVLPFNHQHFWEDVEILHQSTHSTALWTLALLWSCVALLLSVLWCALCPLLSCRTAACAITSIFITSVAVLAKYGILPLSWVISFLFRFPHPLLFLQLVMNILNSNPSLQCIYSPSSMVSAVNLISSLSCSVIQATNRRAGCNQTTDRLTHTGRAVLLLGAHGFPGAELPSPLCLRAEAFPASLHTRVTRGTVFEVKIYIYVFSACKDCCSLIEKKRKVPAIACLIPFPAVRWMPRVCLLMVFLFLWLLDCTFPAMPPLDLQSSQEPR